MQDYSISEARTSKMFRDLDGEQEAVMRVFSKLNTLLRAGIRESVERVSDANAVRIYQQEIAEAEELLSQRRDALAATIATRRELEQDNERLQRLRETRAAHLQCVPARLKGLGAAT